MAERLLMTEEEKKVLHSYVERRNLVSVGRPSEIAVKVVQEKVRSVVELLGLIDCDLNSAVEQTLSVMEGNFNIQDATLPKIEKWLRIRFGLEQTDRLPIGAAESRLEYGLGSDVASNADSIFLGILAGTWGKLPIELQEAA